MTALKKLFTDLLQARADTDSILRQIDRLVSLGTEEGKDKAFLLDIPMSDAFKKEEEALNAYIAKFCKLESAQPGMKRSVFSELPPVKRLEFVKAGGKVID